LLKIENSYDDNYKLIINITITIGFVIAIIIAIAINNNLI